MLLDYVHIAEELRKKIKADDISYKQLSQEMTEDGIKMDNKRMSRFFRTMDRKWMPEKSLMWLVLRMGFEIDMEMKKLDIDADTCRERARNYSQS